MSFSITPALAVEGTAFVLVRSGVQIRTHRPAILIKDCLNSVRDCVLQCPL
jgi:hypothetical protein